MSQHLVMHNTNVITMDAIDTRGQALAIEAGRIVGIGSNEDMQSLIDDGWTSLDLKDKTVLPGFIDAHQHTMMTGLMATAVDLSNAANIDEIIVSLAQAAIETEKGEWLRGSYLNEQHLSDKRMPTRQDLDKISPYHLVYILHSTGHMCSFNTKGLESLNIPRDLEGYDLEAGEPTGVVRDPGILTFVHPAMSRAIPEEIKVSAIEMASRMAIDKGITTLHCLDGGDLGPGDTKIIWTHRDKLPVRLILYNQSMDLKEVREMNLPRVGGCICADGAFEAHTAALFEPYADEPDNYGALTYSQDVMDRFILAANRAGLQIAVHCESERSIEQVLWAMEKALRDFPRSDHRHRIEHFELPTPNQIERLARVEIIASMQPAFIPAFIGQEKMEIYGKLLGEARLNYVHPYRTILDHGIVITGGSDSPVTSYDPLAGIQAAVTHPNPEERVTLREALDMFTISAAYSAFEEREKGSLEEGKMADLVVLSDDPYKVGAEDIAFIKVEMVFVGGKRHKPI